MALDTASLGSTGSLLNAVPAQARQHGPLPGFQGIHSAKAETVVVPRGYTASVLMVGGDPASCGHTFKQDTGTNAADQSVPMDGRNDGMVYFPIRGSRRGLLVQYNDYSDDVLLFPGSTAHRTAEKTGKSLAGYGVSIIEIKKSRGPDREDDDDDDNDYKHSRRPREWYVVRPSHYSRRITAITPIKIGGPAAGDARLSTRADPTGRSVLGTLNNYAIGHTPWGTYLACEKYFNGHVHTASAPTPGSPEARYGLGTDDFLGCPWHTLDQRSRVSDEPNEPYRFGWVTEIDPFKPESTPVKRTALGRLQHKGARVQEARDGRVVIYSGDGGQSEYIYRYVSRLKWRDAIKHGLSPLDDGTLYVAKFTADGTGHWLPLTPHNPALAGWTLNDILIKTRLAADAVGATKMDQLAWIDTFPSALTAIAALAGSNRCGASANPRAANTHDHAVTWRYRSDWTDPTFHWDIFALAGDSANTCSDSACMSGKHCAPDRIYVAPSGSLWIQTTASNRQVVPDNRAGVCNAFGNNQILCADPVADATRCFLQTPNLCEITSVFITPDERTMFVGIRHAGNAPVSVNDSLCSYSSWSDGATAGRPRSSCIVITKDDCGVIGS